MPTDPNVQVGMGSVGKVTISSYREIAPAADWKRGLGVGLSRYFFGVWSVSSTPSANLNVMGSSGLR